MVVSMRFWMNVWCGNIMVFFMSIYIKSIYKYSFILSQEYYEQSVAFIVAFMYMKWI